MITFKFIHQLKLPEIDKLLEISLHSEITAEAVASKIEEKQSRKLNTEEIRLIKTVAPIMRLTATEDENGRIAQVNFEFVEDV